MAEHEQKLLQTRTTINQYLLLSPAEQAAKWTVREFVSGFPMMVKALLNEDGQNIYSIEQRKQIFDSSIVAFQTYTHNPTGGGKSTTSTTAMYRFVGEYYDIDTDEVSKTNVRKPSQTDIFRVTTAGIIALAMSIPETNDSDSMSKFLAYINSLPPKDRFLDRISYLLPLNSLERTWIKNNKLDSIINNAWDKELASLILNFSKYKVDTNNVPHSLPPFLTAPDLTKEYSTDALKVFIEYVLNYATFGKMTTERAHHLTQFTVAIRQSPELMEQEEIRTGIALILRATNTPPEPSETALGKIYNARNLLEQYRSLPRHMKHYRDVKDIRS